MTEKDFVVSADGHLLEPIDLFKTRLPENLRDMAVWEEEIEIEPFVEGGARVFRKLHTPGFEGWTVSRYRQTSGRTPEGDPEIILEDMDVDGVDAQVLHPNLSQFGLFTDHHEMSIAHARVYNDYVMERFTPYFDRLAPTAPIPLTDIDDAVAEIERVAAGGFKAVLLPAMAPRPYYLADYDPVWAAVQASGMSVFVHTQTGGIKVNDPEALTLKVMLENAQQVNQPMTEKMAAKRMVTQAVMQPIVPQTAHLPADRRRRARALPRPALLADRVQRLLALVAGRLDGQVLDHRHRPGPRLVDRRVGRRPSRRRPARHGPAVPPQREVAVPADAERVRGSASSTCRSRTTPWPSPAATSPGLSTIMWGNDYPHAEGTFRGSQELLTTLMAGVPDDERKAMVGGTLGDLLGFEAPVHA